MLGAIIFLLVFSSLPAQTTSNGYNDADAYEVYAAILPSEWPLRIGHSKQLVIRRETRSFQMCLKPDAEIQARVGPAIADYVKQNEKTWLLQPKLSFDIPYQFLETARFEAVLREGSWPAYYRKYPDSRGLIEFSAVGFDADKTVAVVYMGHMCDMLCGGGMFHVLEKIDGKWKPFEWKGSWRSWAS